MHAMKARVGKGLGLGFKGPGSLHGLTLKVVSALVLRNASSFVWRASQLFGKLMSFFLKLVSFLEKGVFF